MIDLGIKRFKREHPYKKTGGSVVAEFKSNVWEIVKLPIEHTTNRKWRRQSIPANQAKGANK